MIANASRNFFKHYYLPMARPLQRLYIDQDLFIGALISFNKEQTHYIRDVIRLSDGASITLVMSEDKALELGLKPKAYFRGFTTVGCNPDEMGIGPVFAIPKLLAQNNLTIEDIGLWELNEAFAVQVVYCRDELGIPMDKLNVDGGSIAIGHPFGMTGSRLTGHIVRELQNREQQFGVVTMCVGGGMGAAGLFERYPS